VESCILAKEAEPDLLQHLCCVIAALMLFCLLLRQVVQHRNSFVINGRDYLKGEMFMSEEQGQPDKLASKPQREVAAVIAERLGETEQEAREQASSRYGSRPRPQ
jgi:hypothetical protein